MSASPNYFGTRVLRAEYLTVLTGDVATFKSDLNFVINGDPNSEPSIAAEKCPRGKKGQSAFGQDERALRS